MNTKMNRSNNVWTLLAGMLVVVGLLLFFLLAQVASINANKAIDIQNTGRAMLMEAQRPETFSEQ